MCIYSILYNVPSDLYFILLFFFLCNKCLWALYSRGACIHKRNIRSEEEKKKNIEEMYILHYHTVIAMNIVVCSKVMHYDNSVGTLEIKKIDSSSP